jgi:hypothetical protein
MFPLRPSKTGWNLIEASKTTISKITWITFTFKLEHHIEFFFPSNFELLLQKGSFTW